MFTFEDAIAHALDYIGGNPSDLGNRESRRAVINAYRDLATEHNWTYLFSNGRIHLNAAFSDPTYSVTFTKAAVAADQTATPPVLATPANTWTLVGATLPSWASNGYVRIEDVIYRVDQVLNDQQFTTIDNLSPDSDIATPSDFTLYQDTYELPRDFSASDQLLYQRSFGGMSYVHPSDWLQDNRFTNQVGQCRWYTATGDIKYPGRLVMRVFPYPGEEVSVDFVYRRMSRPLVYSSINDGSASVTNGSALIPVSGSTSLSSALVGSVVRLSSNSSRPPTGPTGNNPYVYEGVIIDFSQVAQALIVDYAPLFNGSALKYSVSDPIDIDEVSMLTAFLRGVEKQISMQRVMKDKPSARNQYEEALKKAKASDSRSFAGRVVGQQGSGYRQRLARMPMSFD